jgi:hypothetical protein
MDDVRAIYSSCVLALTLALAGATAAAPLTLPPPKPGATYAPATSSAIGAAEAPAPYPTFASIPPFPKDVRPVSAWKTAVLAIKGEGAQVDAQAAGPWTLNDSEAWAAQERAEATPPPPVTTPSDLDTAAYAAAMIARATPPPPLRHAAGANPATHHP